MYVLTIPLCDSGGQNLLTSRTPRHTWGEHKSARQSCWSNLHMYMYDYMRCAVKHTTRRLRARSHTFVLAFIQLYVYVHVHIRLHWHSYNYTSTWTFTYVCAGIYATTRLRARSHTFVLAFIQLQSTCTFTYVCAGVSKQGHCVNILWEMFRNSSKLYSCLSVCCMCSTNRVPKCY
jgi:hypothetical protein